MLTRDDLKSMGDLIETKLDKKFAIFEGKIDQKFDTFAVIVKNSLDSKPDKEEVEDHFNIIENKIDLLSFRVNQYHDRRLDLLEDNVRQIKTKLQM